MLIISILIVLIVIISSFNEAIADYAGDRHGEEG